MDKARTAAVNAGLDPADHFGDVTRMVGIGSGAQRELTRAHREAVARRVREAALDGRIADIRELLRTSDALDTLIPGPWRARRRG